MREEKSKKNELQLENDFQPSFRIEIKIPVFPLEKCKGLLFSVFPWKLINTERRVTSKQGNSIVYYSAGDIFHIFVSGRQVFFSRILFLLFTRSFPAVSMHVKCCCYNKPLDFMCLTCVFVHHLLCRSVLEMETGPSDSWFLVRSGFPEVIYNLNSMLQNDRKESVRPLLIQYFFKTISFQYLFVSLPHHFIADCWPEGACGHCLCWKDSFQASLWTLLPQQQVAHYGSQRKQLISSLFLK